MYIYIYIYIYIAELRKEVGVKESLTRTLVRSRLKWTGYVERVEGERLTTRGDALRVEGRKVEREKEDRD